MAAIGSTYASLTEFKAYLEIEGGVEDIQLGTALTSASEEVENHCHRQFNRDEVVSEREGELVGRHLAIVDDFYTTDDLVITVGDVAVTDYRLEPLNGMVNGKPRPYRRVILRRPVYHRDRVRVTAKWGWASVPAPVRQACLILAAQNYKLSDAPLGLAGFKDFGVAKVYKLPQVESMLCDYTLGNVLVA